MKLAHISDLHLGYSSGKRKDEETKVNLREQDGYNAYFECIEQMIENKVDAVICTGDFFHSPKPSVYSIVQAQLGLQKLSKAGIPFYNLAGNHDATDAIKDIPANRVLHFPMLHLHSFVEPYVTVDIGENIVLHLVSHHGYTAQEKTMEAVKPIKEGVFNILCTHGSCYDEEVADILHSDSSPREVIIPEKVIALDWDYILMGHIHERGWVSSRDRLTDTSGKKQFYGGSLIRRGFSDKECKLGRGWTLWEINSEERTMEPTFFNIAQRDQFDFFIDCDNKKAEQIEKEITILFEGIDLSRHPIVRINLVDVSAQQKMRIDWKKFSEPISECLTFTHKATTKEEARALLSGATFSFDLFQAYSEFWEQIKENYDERLQSNIRKESNELLKRGQEQALA